MTTPSPTDSQAWTALKEPEGLPPLKNPALPDMNDPLASTQASQQDLSVQQQLAPPIPTLEDVQEAQARAQKVLNNPSVMVGMGPRQAAHRRAASLWEKTKYVVAPALIMPMAVGVVGAVGFVTIATGIGLAVPAVGMGTGMVIGIMAATTVLPPAMSVLQVVGIFQAVSRLRMPRTELAEILDNRRRAKIGRRSEKAALKAHKSGRAPEPAERGPAISAYSHLFTDSPAPAPAGYTPVVQRPKGPR